MVPKPADYRRVQLLAQGNVLLDPVELLARDERAKLGVRLHGITNFELVHSADETIEEAVMNLTANYQTRPGSADLAAIVATGQQRPAERRLQIRIGKNDIGSF